MTTSTTVTGSGSNDSTGLCVYPYRPSCDVHGCPEIGGWLVGSHGFRKLGDERTIGKFCAEHGMERIAALDPMRFGGGAK